MKVYVGGMSTQTTEAQLKALFTPFGTPTSVNIATDKGNGTSRGFGFVEFSSDAEANAAIAALNGKEVDGKVLKVNESRPKTAGAPR